MYTSIRVFINVMLLFEHYWLNRICEIVILFWLGSICSIIELSWGEFVRISQFLQGYFTGTGAIIIIILVPVNRHGKYGQIHHMIALESVYILIYDGLVTPYGDADIGQRWYR